MAKSDSHRSLKTAAFEACVRLLRLRGSVPLLAIGAIATLTNLFPNQTYQALEPIFETVRPDLASSSPTSEHYRIVEGSVYDGDTLRVTDGSKELKIRFCGIDAPETKQPMGIEARDHLRSLISQGDGSVIVVPVETDRYERTVAELFIPIGGEEEIHLNSQMVMDGFAYHYAQYSSSCPNQNNIMRAEGIAKEQSLGVWSDLNAEKPWDYRRRS